MIKAFEASAITSVNLRIKKDPLKDYQPLLETISKRIYDAAKNGKTSTTLCSIASNGSIVRGLGTYLEKNLIEMLSFYLIEQGYNVTEKMNESLRQNIVTISWAHCTLSLEK